MFLLDCKEGWTVRLGRVILGDMVWEARPKPAPTTSQLLRRQGLDKFGDCHRTRRDSAREVHTPSKRGKQPFGATF